MPGEARGVIYDPHSRRNIGWSSRPDITAADPHVDNQLLTTIVKLECADALWFNISCQRAHQTSYAWLALFTSIGGPGLMFIK